MKIKNDYLYLLIVAFLAGIIWRIEVEWHGWHGLIWLSYFHYALPGNFVMVLPRINFQVTGISVTEDRSAVTKVCKCTRKEYGKGNPLMSDLCKLRLQALLLKF